MSGLAAGCAPPLGSLKEEQRGLVSSTWPPTLTNLVGTFCLQELCLTNFVDHCQRLSCGCGLGDSMTMLTDFHGMCVCQSICLPGGIGPAAWDLPPRSAQHMATGELMKWKGLGII